MGALRAVDSQDKDERVASVYLRVGGRVQGVGFRWHVQQAAERLGVRGYVRNLPDGDVEVAAEGPSEAVEAVVETVRRGPRSSRVARFDRRDLETLRGFERFEVRF